MLISCPACEVSFSVPAGAIGEDGRKVKCSKCSHVWHQEPVDFDRQKLNDLLETSEAQSANSKVAEKADVSDIKGEVKPSPSAEKVDDQISSVKRGAEEVNNLPVKVSKKLVYSLAASFSFFALLFVGFLYANKSLAAADYNGLRFASYSFEKEVIGNKYDLFFRGAIINVTDKEIKIPDVNMKILSKGGRVMMETKVAPEFEVVPPYSRMEFSPELVQVSGNADKVVMSFSNWAEKIFD